MTKEEKAYYKEIMSLCDTLTDKHSAIKASDLDAFSDELLISELLRVKYAGEVQGADEIIQEASVKADDALAMLTPDMIIPDYYIDKELEDKLYAEADEETGLSKLYCLFRFVSVVLALVGAVTSVQFLCEWIPKLIEGVWG